MTTIESRPDWFPVSSKHYWINWDLPLSPFLITTLIEYEQYYDLTTARPSADSERTSPGPSALETTVGIFTAVLALAAVAVAIIQVHYARKCDKLTQNIRTPSNYRGLRAHNNSLSRAPLIRQLQLHLEGILRNIILIETCF